MPVKNKNLMRKFRSAMHFATPGQRRQVYTKRNELLDYLNTLGGEYSRIAESEKSKLKGSSMTIDGVAENPNDPILRLFNAVAKTNPQYIANMKLEGLDTDIRKPDPFGVDLTTPDIKRSLGSIPETRPYGDEGSEKVNINGSGLGPVSNLLKNDSVIDDDGGAELPGIMMTKLTRKKMNKASLRKLKKYKKRLRTV